MRNVLKFRNLILSVILTALLISTVGFSFSAFNHKTFAAENTESTELYLPSSDLEYKSISSPIDVYHDDNVTAIIHNYSLLVHVDGEYKSALTDFKNIKQVKKADGNTLLVSDDGSIYPINLNSLSIQSALTDNNNKTIGGNYFDVSPDYLVTAYGEGGSIYRRASNGNVYVKNFTLDGDKPVAINQNNQIFYVTKGADSGIYTLNATSTEDAVKISDASPSKMIADNENVYYLLSNSNKVYKLNLSDNSVTELLASAPDYDLGNLSAPSGLAFKGKNLLITDSKLNAVQEFEVKDNNLVFTGFAVAADKTAYNRISKTATDIEKYGNTTAVLDENKLTVISDVNTEKYSTDNFKNYVQGKNVDDNVQYFALGNGTIVYSTAETTLKKLDLNNFESEPKQIELPVTSALIDDITYQSGIYYILIHTSTSSIVYSLDETAEQMVLTEILRQGNSTNYGEIAVDVFNNLFISDKNGVYKYSLNEENKYERISKVSDLVVQKMSTDLGGKLYLLNNGSIKVYDGTSVKDVTPAPHVNGDVIKSFAMNFDKKEVYLLYNNKEYICASTTLENYALSEATANDQTFVITGASADVNNLRLATVKDGANVYSSERNGVKFDFKELILPENEYIYICDIRFDDKLTLCAIVGHNGVSLVNKTELNLAAATQDSAPEKAFVTTDVNAYFMPIITKNAEFALNYNGSIRLSKQTQISPLSKISALGKDFYFANVTVSGKTYKGYVPVDFTVEILSQDFEWDSYVIETVEKTTLYKDDNLSETIAQLSDGKEVRVISSENGVAKVAVEINGSFIEGFISADAINNDPKIVVRNVLIILGVTACVCGTASYFILRKKKK